MKYWAVTRIMNLIWAWNALSGGVSSSLNPTEGSYYFRRRTSVSSPARKLEAWSKASRRERSARSLGPDADKDLSPVRLAPGLILSTQAKKKIASQRWLWGPAHKLLFIDLIYFLFIEPHLSVKRFFLTIIGPKQMFPCDLVLLTKLLT